MTDTTRPLIVAAEVPDRYRNAVRWVWSHAALVWGHPVELRFGATASPVDVTYATTTPTTGAWLRFDSSCYEANGEFGLGEASGRPIWRRTGAIPDLVGGIYRLLTLLDEHSVRPEDRNRLGIFDTTALPKSRQGVLHLPLAELHLDAMWQVVAAARPDARRTPRWPGGSRWACVLTHDTDATRIGAPLELFYNAAKFLLRRDPMRLAMINAGLRHRSRSTEDPYFGFPIWRIRENELSIRSAFFISHRPHGVRRDIHDVRSTIGARDAGAGILRGMADEGWEFGLHPSIHAHTAAGGLRRSREVLEAQLRIPINGVRHHYWALDWRQPWRTFEQQASAGFRYDASIAWRDISGFRAGTSLPYQPFAMDSQTAIGIWELPTAVMDGHVLNAADPQAAERRVYEIANEVRDAGGVLVLNWHTEAAGSAYDRVGYMAALDRILDGVLGADVWLTSPSRLLDHWDTRQRNSRGIVVAQ